MNPLEKIKNWLLELEPETAVELLFIANQFHPVKEIRNGSSFEALNNLLPYLESKDLDFKEICARSMVVINLINYGLEGKGTDKYWQDAIDKNLDLRSYIRDEETDDNMKQGMNETIDKSLSGFPARKELWKKVCASWEELLSEELTNKQITEWYFSQARK